jgi:hypothetical protein
MRQLIRSVYWLFCAIIILSRCQSAKIPTSAEIENLLIVTYTVSSEVKNGYGLNIMIENQSDYCIDFSPNYNMVINVSIEEKLIEASNMVIIIGDKPDILLPNGDPGSIDFFTVNPDLSDYKILKASDAKVVIFGHLCDDENFIIEKNIPFTIVP